MSKACTRYNGRESAHRSPDIDQGV